MTSPSGHQFDTLTNFGFKNNEILALKTEAVNSGIEVTGFSSVVYFHEREKPRLSAIMLSAQAEASNFHSKLSEKIKEIKSLESSSDNLKVQLSEQQLKIASQAAELVCFRAQLKAQNKKNIKLTKQLNEANDNYSIAQSYILALEESMSSFNPQKSLKNKTNTPKKS